MKKNPVGILRQAGFRNMLLYMPNELGAIIKSSRNHNALTKTIGDALSFQNGNELCCFLLLADMDRKLLSEIIFLARTDPYLANSIAKSLLIYDHVRNQPGIETLTTLAPIQVAEILELAKVNVDLRSSIGKVALNKFYNFENGYSVKFQTLDEIIACVKGEYATGVFGLDIKLKYRQHLEKFGINIGDLIALSSAEAVSFVSEKITVYQVSNSKQQTPKWLANQ